MSTKKQARKKRYDHGKTKWRKAYARRQEVMPMEDAMMGLLGMAGIGSMMMMRGRGKVVEEVRTFEAQPDNGEKIAVPPPTGAGKEEE